MGMSSSYNFRNPVRHFIDIDHLEYPQDITTFKPIRELCWTKPVAFRIYKEDDRFRTIKMPNILNYVRALKYYSGLNNFNIGPWLVKLVTGTNNPIVIKNATNYLKFDTLFYYVTAVICIVRNAMQGLGEQITPLVSSSLEMVGKIVIAFTLVPLLGYTGVIVAEPLVWFIMVIPLLVKIYTMPVLRKQPVSVSLKK